MTTTQSNITDVPCFFDLVRLYNLNTGCYYVIGHGFIANEYDASVLEPQQAALVKAMFLNVGEHSIWECK